MVEAIIKELSIRKKYLFTPVRTIYFGGGTPSLLAIDQIEQIQECIAESFQVIGNPEITLEANPEDLSVEKCSDLRRLGVNRLSIGLQSFEDKQLKWMNRVHSTRQSYGAFRNAREAGFDNISLDLMYALPNGGQELFKKDLNEMAALNPEHISIYGLTIEEQTVFGSQKKKGQLIEIPEDQAAQQYLETLSFLDSKNYVQYEVSNFGKEGFYSKHNMAYWDHKPYLGIGPGAHSYNGKSRSFNVRSNAKYIKALSANNAFSEEELLTPIQQLNERILTGLRTTKGIDCERLAATFAVDVMEEKKEVIESLSSQNLLTLEKNSIKLNANGFLVADAIALQLFFHE